MISQEGGDLGCQSRRYLFVAPAQPQVIGSSLRLRVALMCSVKILLTLCTDLDKLRRLSKEHVLRVIPKLCAMILLSSNWLTMFVSLVDLIIIAAQPLLTTASRKGKSVHPLMLSDTLLTMIKLTPMPLRTQSP